MELILGGGNWVTKKLFFPEEGKEYKNPITVDIDPDCNPHTVWDLNLLPYPFGDESFEEIHAYEILEHLGTQGDWKFFFDQFSELHRILTEKGRIYFSVPDGTTPAAFCDPGHTRVFTGTTFSFLSQKEYRKQIGTTAMTDYRHYWKKDFDLIHYQSDGDTLYLVLQKV